jgi:hypothetical protein
MKALTGMSPGKLGHGCDQSEVALGIAAHPHFVAADAGSTDMGPFYMGRGVPFFHPLSVKRDLKLLLDVTQRAKIPLVVGNAITVGTNALLRNAMEVLREAALEVGVQVKVALVTAELEKTYLKSRMSLQQIEPLGERSPLTYEDVDSAVVIVAQMGVEPLIEALDTGADVVMAGRACDDALFAAIPVREGFDKGLALHMGKILECGSMACIPGDLHGSLLGHLHEDHFVLEPSSPHRVCTVQSVASHTLYERTNPYLQAGPGGINDLSNTRFEQLDKGRVRVTGSQWVADPIYKVKLEGVRFTGHRAICISGVRDPQLIKCLPEVLRAARIDTYERFRDEGGTFEIVFRQYGRNAIMGESEPQSEDLPHEVGLLIEVIAATQALADAVCMYVRGTIQHAYYDGILATAGNLAYPFSPFTIACGPVYQFHVDHLMALDDPTECFQVVTETVGSVMVGPKK